MIWANTTLRSALILTVLACTFLRYCCIQHPACTVVYVYPASSHQCRILTNPLVLWRMVWGRCWKMLFESLLLYDMVCTTPFFAQARSHTRCTFSPPALKSSHHLVCNGVCAAQFMKQWETENHPPPQKWKKWSLGRGLLFCACALCVCRRTRTTYISYWAS